MYRSDELDATYTPVFHQVEGLAVDKGNHDGGPAGTLNHFAAAMFGDGIVTRLRPSFFPFTGTQRRGRPAVFRLPRGKRGAIPNGHVAPAAARVGSSGRLRDGEPAGAHRLRVDPEVYSGFAFGMGLERTLMFRHGITDMRDLIEGDIRFT